MIRATVVRAVSRRTSAMSHRGQPRRVPHHLDAARGEVKDPPDLVDVGRGVELDLLGGERRAGRRAARRVADPGGEVPDDEHRDVAEVLELAQLAQHDREPEVDVRRGRVDAQLHPERPARTGAWPRSSGLGDAVHRPRGQDPQLLLHGGHRRTLPAALRGRREAGARVAHCATMLPVRRRSGAVRGGRRCALVAAGCRYTSDLRLPEHQAVSSAGPLGRRHAS